MQVRLRARERSGPPEVSRSGARPEPTVIVRMKENALRKQPPFWRGRLRMR